MSNDLPARPASTNGSSHRLAIIASEYNSLWVNALLENCRREITLLRPQISVTVHRVPGAFEIPVVVQEVALGGQADAVIALGVILQGATAHADLIGRNVTNALQGIALATRTPVIHEVLLVADEAQAEARTMGEKLNRGTEAARVAVKMLDVMDSLKEGLSSTNTED